MRVKIKVRVGDGEMEVWANSQDLPLACPTADQFDYKKRIRVFQSEITADGFTLVGAWTHQPGWLVADKIILDRSAENENE